MEYLPGPVKSACRRIIEASHVGIKLKKAHVCHLPPCGA